MATERVMNESNKETYLAFFKALHALLKKEINASINVRIYGKDLHITIKRFDKTFKYIINDIEEYINGGEEVILELAHKIITEYSAYILNMYFYNVTFYSPEEEVEDGSDRDCE